MLPTIIPMQSKLNIDDLAVFGKIIDSNAVHLNNQTLFESNNTVTIVPKNDDSRIILKINQLIITGQSALQIFKGTVANPQTLLHTFYGSRSSSTTYYRCDPDQLPL